MNQQHKNKHLQKDLGGWHQQTKECLLPVWNQHQNSSGMLLNSLLHCWTWEWKILQKGSTLKHCYGAWKDSQSILESKAICVPLMNEDASFLVKKTLTKIVPKRYWVGNSWPNLKYDGTSTCTHKSKSPSSSHRFKHVIKATDLAGVFPKHSGCWIGPWL